MSERESNVHRSPSEEDLRAFASALADRLQAGDVLTLRGELGAGKTTFVRGLAEGLGIDPNDVSSPTFTLVQEYTPVEGGTGLVHIDAYRLDPDSDLESIGWEELADGTRIVAIEWPDRLPPGSIARAIEVMIQHAPINGRVVSVKGLDAQHSVAHGPQACRACGKLIPQDAPSFPFCGERCRRVDLSAWFDGRYSISRELKDADLETTD
ncbi:MAG: tRNA (adenosine(37)-N6)-threonylcarbamoyltransferase complex ATPase subunit type 1 TsaE [Planctomycetota bacterium]